MDVDSKKRKAEAVASNGSQVEYESCTYTAQRVLGKGSFGVVYQAQVMETGEIVAIKASRLLEQEKDREVQVLVELNGHPNIVGFRGVFLSNDGPNGETRLNLVLEFLADTVHRVIKHYNSLSKTMDHDYVRLYMYQLLRGLNFVHSKGIVHCDVKPQNLLLDGRTHTLKVCDFGTAKRMVYGQPLRAYVCSRYYRAPECILGSTEYTTAVDLWAAGCVLGEMLLGQPLFTGKDGIDQLLEIIKVRGTPTAQELAAMNPQYPPHEFSPKVEPLPWDRVFRMMSPREANELADSMLRFDPQARLPPLHAMMHRFFGPLRVEEHPINKTLFNFAEEELWSLAPSDRSKLMPRR